MPRYKDMKWGEGSRQRQPVYPRDKKTNKVVASYDSAKKKLIPAYYIWKGYDWIEIDPAQVEIATELGFKVNKNHRIRIRATVKRDETRDDLILLLERKRNILLYKLNGGQSQSEEWLQEYNARMEDRLGGPPLLQAPLPPTLNEVIERYFGSSATKRMAEHGTKANYLGYWENHIKLPVREDQAPLGENIMVEIEENDLQNLDSILQTKRNAPSRKRNNRSGEIRIVESIREPLSPKSFGDLISWLGAVWHFAMQPANRAWTGIRHNVPREYTPDRVKSTSSGKVTRTLLTMEQMIKLADTAVELGDEPIAALIGLMICAVDRPNALMSLEWGMYDPSNGFLLNGQWVVFGGERRWVPLKNKEPKYIQVPEPLGKYIFSTREFSTWVVPVSRKIPSRRLSKTTLGERWDVIEAKAEIKCTPYDLKHSVLTRLRDQGVPMDQLKAVAAVGNQMIDRHYLLESGDLRVKLINSLFVTS